MVVVGVVVVVAGIKVKSWSFRGDKGATKLNMCEQGGRRGVQIWGILW